MEQHLKFTIGSVFQNEGFTKLTTAVKNANTTARQATTAAQQAASALGGLDTSGSKAATAVTGLVQAFMAGGVQGAVFAGAMMGINVYLSKMKDELDEALKRTEKLKASVKQTFIDTANDIKGGFTKEIAEIASKFDTITKSATAFTAAMNGLSASQSAGNVINLEIEKFNAMLEAGTEAEKKRIEATYALKIAEENAAATETQQARKVELATNSRIVAEMKLSEYREEQNKLAAEIANVEKTYELAVENETENRKDVAKLLADLKDKQKDLSAKETQAKLDVTNLTLAEQTAIQNQTNALAQSKLATQKASAALESLSKAANGFEQNEFVEAQLKQQAADELKEAETERAEMLKKLTESESGAKSAADKLKSAEAKLAAAIEAYNANIAQNLVNEAIRGGGITSNGQTSGITNTWGQLIAQRGEITAQAADVTVDGLLKSGAILTTDELRKARNQAVRDANDVINSKSVNQQIKDEERALRLSRMSEKAMSKADKEWLEDYKKVSAAKDAQKNAVAAAKDEKEFAQLLARKQFEDVQAIRKKLDQLGLK